MFTETSGEFEDYRENIKGIVFEDSNTDKYYRLDGELAEYFLSKILKKSCSLSSIIDNIKLREALYNSDIIKIHDGNWKEYIDEYIKLDNITHEELVRIAEKSEPILGFVGKLSYSVIGAFIATGIFSMTLIIAVSIVIMLVGYFRGLV